MKQQPNHDLVVKALEFNDSPRTAEEAVRVQAGAGRMRERLGWGWRRKLALALEAVLADTLPDVPGLVGYCVFAFEHWGTPPQWTTVAWREEIVLEAATAAVEVLAEYAGAKAGTGPVRGDVQRRIVTRVRRRHQKEWVQLLLQHSVSGRPFYG